MNPLTIFARRFVAGERPQDAVRAGERLHAKGIKATFDKLGEDVLDKEAARRATDAAKELLRLIPPGIERNISIKMSSMGQEISRELCLENVGSTESSAVTFDGITGLNSSIDESFVHLVFEIWSSDGGTKKRVALLTDDTSTTTAKFKNLGKTAINTTDNDIFVCIGNAQKEGDVSPEAWADELLVVWNQCQIFRTPIQISGTVAQASL